MDRTGSGQARTACPAVLRHPGLGSVKEGEEASCSLLKQGTKKLLSVLPGSRVTFWKAV
jgi:hypothetical protein